MFGFIQRYLMFHVHRWLWTWNRSNTTRNSPATCFTGAYMASPEVFSVYHLTHPAHILDIYWQQMDPVSLIFTTKIGTWCVIWSQSIWYSNFDCPDVINKLLEHGLVPWLYSTGLLPYAGPSAHQQIKDPVGNCPPPIWECLWSGFVVSTKRLDGLGV